jgi:MYXO-CTERM domain-containing protein
LTAIVPLLETAYTSVVPNVEITPIPKVEDVNDIDNNSNTTHVPDYDNFPTLNMTPKVPMEQNLTVNVPAFPARTGGWHYDGVILLAGVLVQGAGMLPLGINAGIDAANEGDTLDGAVDSPIVMKVSDVAGRIPEDQVQRMVLALALNVGDLSAEEPQPFALAGQVIFLGDSFDTTVTLDSFMAPATISYNETTRTLDVADIPANADYCHTIFSTGDGSTFWHVLGEWAAGSYTLPAAPTTGDRSATATFVSIDLIDGLDFADLPEFNSTNMGDMAELVKSFVVVSPPGAGIGGMDCEDCSTTGTGGGLILALLLGLALLRRRRR